MSENHDTIQKIKQCQSIERCPHDAKNPYTMVRNSLIRDKSISPNCRMLLIFLLSNEDFWTIQIKHICREFKDHLGRDFIYKLIAEAIESGYMQRIEYKENNFKRYKYRISEIPKFKKCFLYPGSQETGRQDTENPDRKEGTSTNSSSIDIKKQQQQEERARDQKTPEHPPFAAAALPASQKKEHKASKLIYHCLKDIDAAEYEKQWLTDTYSEETVQNAIEFAQERHHTFSIPFIAVIKYAAQNGLKCEIQAFKETNQDLIESAKKLDGKVNPEKTIRIDVCCDRVEFVRLGATILPVIVRFDDKTFKRTMHHHLVKYGFMK